MEKHHNELLAAKEHELTARINQAVVNPYLSLAHIYFDCMI